MSGQDLAGIVVAMGGLGGFGLLLAVRARRAARAGGTGPVSSGVLRPVQALSSPTGDWVAVVESGPPFDSRFDSLLESAMWTFLWLFPVRLCRIEVKVLALSGEGRAGPPAVEALHAKPPLVSRLIWRGAGGPREAERVTLRWIGPRTLCALYQGTTHTIEVESGG